MKVRFRRDKSDGYGLCLVIPTISILYDPREWSIALMWLSFGLYFELKRKKDGR
jgi:hypothetical protein